jgi:hypothetical protein
MVSRATGRSVPRGRSSKLAGVELIPDRSWHPSAYYIYISGVMQIAGAVQALRLRSRSRRLPELRPRACTADTMA